MRRKMKVTLTMYVEDLSDEQRVTLLDEMGGAEEVGPLPDLKEYLEDEARSGWSEASPEPLGGTLENYLEGIDMEELFEGSDTFVALSGITATACEWIGEPEGSRPSDRSGS